MLFLKPGLSFSETDPRWALILQCDDIYYYLRDDFICRVCACPADYSALLVDVDELRRFIISSGKRWEDWEVKRAEALVPGLFSE